MGMAWGGGKKKNPEEPELTSHPKLLPSRSCPESSPSHSVLLAKKCDFYGATKGGKKKNGKYIYTHIASREETEEKNLPLGGPIKISATDDNVDDDDYENGDEDEDGDGDGDDYENG